MCVAALYDILGNLPAVEAVLTEIEAEGVEAVVVAGPTGHDRGRRVVSSMWRSCRRRRRP